MADAGAGVLDTVLVAPDLAVEHGGDLVDRRVHVAVRVLDMDVVTLHVKVDFRRVPMFLVHVLFVEKRDADVDHLVEMPHHAVELVQNVPAHGRRHFDVMSFDFQIH